MRHVKSPFHAGLGGRGGATAEITLPFVPGRWDSTQEQADVESVAPREPAANAGRKFVDDLVAAWTKVMQLDRFDL